MEAFAGLLPEAATKTVGVRFVCLSPRVHLTPAHAVDFSGGICLFALWTSSFFGPDEGAEHSVSMFLSKQKGLRPPPRRKQFVVLSQQLPR